MTYRRPRDRADVTDRIGEPVAVGEVLREMWGECPRERMRRDALDSIREEKRELFATLACLGSAGLERTHHYARVHERLMFASSIEDRLRELR